MTNFRAVVLGVLVLFAASGCDIKQKVTVNSPTSPSGPSESPPSVIVTEVSVSTPTLSITLNACPATIGFTAIVRGTNVTQTVNWESTGGGTSTPSGTTATLSINAAGTYTVTARSTQNASVSGTVTVTATGNCARGPEPTPPTPTPTPPTPTPSACTFTVQPTSRHFPYTGGSDVITITASRPDCGWSVVSDSSWITGSDGVSSGFGTGSGTLSYSVFQNPGGPRTGHITVAGQVVTITEDGVPGPTSCPPGQTGTPPNCVPIPPPTARCVLTQALTPNTGSGQPGQTMTVFASFGSEGGAVCQPTHYFSSDPSKVSVHPGSGLVTFISVGSATICAQPNQATSQPQTCGTFTTTVVSTPNQAPTVTFSANPQSINQGQSSNLVWSTTNATSCTASGGWSGGKSVPNGSEMVTPSVTTTYMLTCVGPGGQASGSTTVTVATPPPPPPPPAPTVTLNFNPTSVSQGGSSNGNWTSTNAVSCTKSNGWNGAAGTSGSQTVVLSQTTTFRVTCVNSAGVSAYDEKTVTVTAPSCPSSIDYTPSGGSIAVGQVRQLTVSNWPSSSSCQPFWYSRDPSKLQVNGGDTMVIINGQTYYGGIHGNIRGIWTGTVEACVQTSLVTPQVLKCYTWTVVP